VWYSEGALKIKNQKPKIKNLLVGFLVLFIPQIAFAQSTTTVEVKTNTGNNTVCVNNKCETRSSGTSKSRVCVNGECHESDGDLKVESQNGKTKVDIKSKSSNSGSTDEEKARQEDEKEKEKEEVEEGKVRGASSPEEEGPVDEDNEKKDEFSLVVFVEEQLSFLRRIITFQFLFGNK
jgi:hypothetical protein